MFETIGVGREHCHFCGEYGPVAELYSLVDPPENNVPACEKCIRAAVKAADLLKVLRQAKAKPPKKARTPTKRAPAASRTAPTPLGPYDRDERSEASP